MSEALSGQKKDEKTCIFFDFDGIFCEKTFVFRWKFDRDLHCSHAKCKFDLKITISWCVFEGQLRVARYLQQLTTVPGSSGKVILPKTRFGKCSKPCRAKKNMKTHAYSLILTVYFAKNHVFFDRKSIMTCITLTQNVNSISKLQFSVAFLKVSSASLGIYSNLRPALGSSRKVILPKMRFGKCLKLCWAQKDEKTCIFFDFDGIFCEKTTCFSMKIRYWLASLSRKMQIRLQNCNFMVRFWRSAPRRSVFTATYDLSLAAPGKSYYLKWGSGSAKI